MDSQNGLALDCPAVAVRIVSRVPTESSSGNAKHEGALRDRGILLMQRKFPQTEPTSALPVLSRGSTQLSTGVEIFRHFKNPSTASAHHIQKVVDSMARFGVGADACGRGFIRNDREISPILWPAEHPYLQESSLSATPLCFALPMPLPRAAIVIPPRIRSSQNCKKSLPLTICTWLH
jgi:hypothetical protein